MLPQNLIAQYMDSFFLKAFKFYDKSKKVTGSKLIDWPESYLNEKTLVIDLKKDFYYTQAICQLSLASLNYQHRFYMLLNPNDTQFSAGKPYREYLTKNFDLVAVE